MLTVDGDGSNTIHWTCVFSQWETLIKPMDCGI